MSFIEIDGIVDEQGELQVKLPPGVSPGKVTVIIIEEDADDNEDDVRWEELFATRPDIIDYLADKAIKAKEEGRLRDFDPILQEE